jgi:hypothetical protein
MTMTLKQLSVFLTDKNNLLEDNFEYHKLPYKRICELREGKALVYALEDTPIAEVYDGQGQISTRFAFLGGKWTQEIPEKMNFGGETVRVSVDEFLRLYSQKKSSYRKNITVTIEEWENHEKKRESQSPLKVRDRGSWEISSSVMATGMAEVGNLGKTEKK